jgi:hypothetical protein
MVHVLSAICMLCLLSFLKFEDPDVHLLKVKIGSCDSF